MSDIATETLSVAILAVALLGAIVRPMGLPEAAFALPGALVLVLARVVSWSQVGEALRELGPTVLFLAGILLFGHLCAEAGVFDYLGLWRPESAEVRHGACSAPSSYSRLE